MSGQRDLRVAYFMLILTISVTSSCALFEGNKSTTDRASRASISSVVSFPDEPVESASSEFWDHWGDGKAELATYTGKIERYGELRDVREVLIYVTEPMEREAWIKNDGVSEEEKFNVLKLNHLKTFQTGIYEYSVMTSLFAPVDNWGMRRFKPVKMNLTSQDWCGQVFHGLWIGDQQFLSKLHSYFADEGDHRKIKKLESNVLYQDALWIQLRELDGKFNEGDNWSGKIVPRLWDKRKKHTELSPILATIERKNTTYNETSVTRFVLEYENTEVIYDVEKTYPHRIIHWKHSNGGELRLKKSERLPYWKQNNSTGARHRKKIGLSPKILDRANLKESPETANDDESND